MAIGLCFGLGFRLRPNLVCLSFLKKKKYKKKEKNTKNQKPKVPPPSINSHATK